MLSERCSESFFRCDDEARSPGFGGRIDGWGALGFVAAVCSGYVSVWRTPRVSRERIQCVRVSNGVFKLLRSVGKHRKAEVLNLIPNESWARRPVGNSRASAAQRVTKIWPIICLIYRVRKSTLLGAFDKELNYFHFLQPSTLDREVVAFVGQLFRPHW